MLKYFSSTLAEKSSMPDSPVQIKRFVSLRRIVNKVFRFNIKRNLLILTMKPSILVGGQAVIEGVMMRVPGAYATAVRDPEGKIHIQKNQG